MRRDVDAGAPSAMPPVPPPGAPAGGAGRLDPVMVALVRRAAQEHGPFVVGLKLPDAAPLVLAGTGGGPLASRPELALAMQALFARLRSHGAPAAAGLIPRELLGDDPSSVRVVPIGVDGADGVFVVTGGDEAAARLAPVAAALGLAVAARRESVGRDDGQEEAVAELAGEIAALPRPGRAAALAARYGATSTGFERCTILLRTTGDRLTPVASATVSGPAPVAPWGTLGAGLPAAAAAYRRGEPVVYERPAGAAELLPELWIVPQGINRVVLVPVIAWGEPLGVMVLDAVTPGGVDAADLVFLQTIANQVAVAVKAGEVVDALGGIRRHNQLVLGAVAQAATQVTSEGVLAVLAEAVQELVGDVATCAVAVEGDEAVAAATVGDGPLADALATAVVAGASPAQGGWGAVTTLVGAELEDVPALAASGAGRVLVVPLRRATRHLGYLLSAGAAARDHRPGDLRIVGALAAQAALSLHTARLLETERKAVARLEELGRLKSGFVASVSHELRTPLTAIIGFAEILGEWVEEDEVVAFIDDVRREAIVLEGIIGNLLDTSRLEAGVLSLVPEPVALDQVVAQCVEVLGYSFPNAAVHVDVPPDLPPVWADPVRLRQVILNVIENAAKYGGPPIEVTARHADGQVVIELADGGPGIPVEFRQKVFERFFRMEGAISQPGTGIGLFLVRELVRAHGGTVKIGGGPGEAGCRFTITLPLTMEPAGSSPSPPACA